MENLPLYVSIIFILTTILTVFIFYKAAHKSKTTLIILIIWLIFQGLVAWKEFYLVTVTLPPRFVYLVLPPLIYIIILFNTKSGKRYLDKLDIKMLTLLHIVRIPVELVLLWLFLGRMIPQLMTFEGRNFDILSGLTAPLIYYFGFIKNQLGKSIKLAWNFICLGLLVNIVGNAVLSAPFRFQLFAFDQPNIGVLYFPFVWLPCCIVPLVLLSHLAAIRQLLYPANEKRDHRRK